MYSTLESLADRIESLDFGSRFMAASSIWVLLEALDASDEALLLSEQFSDSASVGALLRRARGIVERESQLGAEVLSDFDVGVTLYLRFLARIMPRSAQSLAGEVLMSPPFYNAKRYAIAIERVLGTVIPFVAIADSAVSSPMEYSAVVVGRSRLFASVNADSEPVDDVYVVSFARYAADAIVWSDIDVQPGAGVDSPQAISQNAA